MTDKYLTYRGDVRAVAESGGGLVFVTVHPEGQATAVYRLDPEKLTLTEHPLPAGGQALLAAGDDLWVAGTDQHLYHLSAKGKKPTARGGAFEAVPMAQALLSTDRLAVAVGARVPILARADGKVLQALELPDPVTCLTSDPTGQWLAVGTTKGTVAVFECETAPAEFRLSDSQPLHEAAVTALLFETDELRFLSAGADQKLLSTHARGRLEAEDRGRGATHEQPITAMIPGPKDRFITGSTDATLKSWPRAKAARPVTLKDGVGKVVALAVVPVHGKPQIVAACDDNTLRSFQLDEEGKFGDAGPRVHGADAWAKHELAESDPKRREAALQALAGFADDAALKRIAAQMTSDADHTLRLLACRLLCDSSHPRAAKALEKGLQHEEDAVRVLAFDGLRRHAGPNDLRPLALALKVGKADVGVRAVEALEGLAAKDDQAMARLTEALQSAVPEVRRAALTSLEKVHAADSPEASLTALGSSHADLRGLALVRLFQRRLLHDPRAQAALRWRGDDPDAEVRRVAFLLSLYTREKLLRALRERDAELNRQLTELEAGSAAAVSGRVPVPAPETTKFTVSLDGLTDPTRKISVIKAVIEITRLGLKEAKDLVEGTPKNIKEGLVKDEAEALKKRLEESGAKVSLNSGQVTELETGSAAPPASSPTPASETGQFSVWLDSLTDPAKKIIVIVAVREITGLGLKEAKDLVEGAPKPLKEGIGKDEAEILKKKFEGIGATVSLR